MEELKILLEECVCEKLIHMTASGARDKDGISKVRIRPVLQKGSLMFQSAARKGKQEFHSNRDRDELIGDVLKFMEEDFRQLQIQMQDKALRMRFKIRMARSRQNQGPAHAKMCKEHLAKALINRVLLLFPGRACRERSSGMPCRRFFPSVLR